MEESSSRDEIARLKAARNTYRQKLHDARARLRQLRQSSLDDYRQARRRWAVPIDRPVLLISQIQRAGGTLLARLFDGHPECFAHPMELKWGRPRKWNWPSFSADASLSDREAFTLLDELWVRKAIRQGGYSKYPRYAAEQKPQHTPRYPFVFDRQLEFELFADACRTRRPGHRRDVLNAYLTALFNAWLDYQNLYAAPKRWVTAFVPRLVMHEDSLERFFDDYPDGKLLTIVRHPGSWFASASRHTFSAEPAEALQHWVASTRASLAAAEQYGHRVQVLLFEDLVLHTEAVMRAVCATTGLTFDPVLLRPTYNSIPVLSDSSFEPSTGVDANVTRRYAAALDPEQTAVVERLGTALYAEAASRYSLRAGGFAASTTLGGVAEVQAPS